MTATELLRGKNWHDGIQHVRIGDRITVDSPTLVDADRAPVEGETLQIHITNDRAQFDDGTRKYLATTNAQGQVLMRVIEVLGTNDGNDLHSDGFTLGAWALVKPEVNGVTNSYGIDSSKS